MEIFYALAGPAIAAIAMTVVIIKNRPAKKH